MKAKEDADQMQNQLATYHHQLDITAPFRSAS